MGKKIDSLVEMQTLGLPCPDCIFIMDASEVEQKSQEYLQLYPSNELYTLRSDTVNSSHSCKRILSATKDDVLLYPLKWIVEDHLQIILQEFIDERMELKSGNIYLLDDKIIIEGARMKHHIFTNGKLPETHIILDRFDNLSIKYHKLFKHNDCFTFSEVLRLIRLARKVPYTKAIIEFSFFKEDKLYFWEIKREV